MGLDVSSSSRGAHLREYLCPIHLGKICQRLLRPTSYVPIWAGKSGSPYLVGRTRPLRIRCTSFWNWMLLPHLRDGYLPMRRSIATCPGTWFIHLLSEPPLLPRRRGRGTFFSRACRLTSKPLESQSTFTSFLPIREASLWTGMVASWEHRTDVLPLQTGKH